MTTCMYVFSLLFPIYIYTEYTAKHMHQANKRNVSVMVATDNVYIYGLLMDCIIQIIHEVSSSL